MRGSEREWGAPGTNTGRVPLANERYSRDSMGRARLGRDKNSRKRATGAKTGARDEEGAGADVPTQVDIPRRHCRVR